MSKFRDEGPQRPVDPNHRAYLEADQSWQDGDQQYRIRIVEPFWATVSEELDYLNAVEETRGMLPSERMEAIAKRFSKGAVAKRMPYPWQNRRERDQKLQELREQSDDEEWWNK